MPTRIGIELSPAACRLVELEGPSIQPGQPPATRVRSYAVLPRSGPETDGRLAALGRRPAAVVLWGVRSDHRQVVVSNGSYEKKRTEALASVRAAGVDTRGAIADIATASTAIKGANRQPVVLALASGEDVSAALQPLRDARVRIESVMTPADALMGLARSRQAFAVPGGIEAYVALDESATCVALVRDGSLLGARELPWGYGDRAGQLAASAGDGIRPRDDLAARLFHELTVFLTTVGAGGSSVAQVSICGGMPDLRTMTVSLMERLDVEVEALDSLFGIDADQLPEPADEFREQASALRLAWAAAADWPGPINLMRHRRRRTQRVALARAAVIAGVAAGLGTGWAIQQSAWWRTTPPLVARRTPAADPPVASPAPTGGTTTSSSATRAVPPPQNSGRGSSAPTPAPDSSAQTARPPDVPAAQAPIPLVPAVPTARGATAPTTNAPQLATQRPAPPVATPALALARPSTATAPPPVVARPPTVTPSASPTVAPARQPVPAPPSPAAPPISAPARQQPSATRPSQPATRGAEERPVPFDAVLGTILYSSDRKLAIVNGRIVGLGDVVNGARIVDIAAGTVLLRDAQGRLRSLTLGPVGSTIAQ